MTVVLGFLAALMLLFVGWLISQSIGVQPWVATTAPDGPAIERGLRGQPNAKVGLVVLMAVMTSLFALFMSAYSLRMDLGDWRPLPEPALLWVNTLVLGLGSVGMQMAYSKSLQGSHAQVMSRLSFAGVCLGLFIAGQLLAWRQLTDAGYTVTANPANAFFYLITGLHGLHLLGGLVVWLVMVGRVRKTSNAAEVALGLQLSAVYIHFLLIVWLALFATMLRT